MLTKKEMKQFKGIVFKLMPDQIRNELYRLSRETGYYRKAEDRNGPWEKFKFALLAGDARIWHDGLEVE